MATSSLTTLLTESLQDKGICRNNYRTISNAVMQSLMDINKQVQPGESIVFPNGDEYVKQ